MAQWLWNTPLCGNVNQRTKKKFQGFVRHGVAKANPTYATQIALYQTYMDLNRHPALFTVVNKNTSEVYYELVPYDCQARARGE